MVSVSIDCGFFVASSDMTGQLNTDCPANHFTARRSPQHGNTSRSAEVGNNGWGHKALKQDELTCLAEAGKMDEKKTRNKKNAEKEIACRSFLS